MPSELEGQVALVTGGGRGIGANIARELASAGMRVAVTGRTAEQVEAVAAEIGAATSKALGKAFRPARVLFVSALPKTRSAKIVRRAVRARALGEDPGDLSSLENPEALDEISRVVGA